MPLLVRFDDLFFSHLRSTKTRCQFYEHGMKLSLTDPDLLRRYVLCLMSLCRYDEAVAVLNQLLSDPTCKDTLMMLLAAQLALDHRGDVRSCIFSRSVRLPMSSLRTAFAGLVAQSTRARKAP